MPKDDKIFIKTAWHKKLYKLGVPRLFWDISSTIDSIGFRQTPFQGEKLYAAQQRSLVKVLSKETRRNNPIIIISSEPTDTGALVVGYHILLSILEKRHPIGIINIGEESTTYFSSYPFGILLHNILDSPTINCCTKVRNLCLRFQHTFRIVILAGVPDPENWFLNHIRLEPTLVFKTKDFSTP